MRSVTISGVKYGDILTFCSIDSGPYNKFAAVSTAFVNLMRTIGDVSVFMMDSFTIKNSFTLSFSGFL